MNEKYFTLDDDYTLHLTNWIDTNSNIKLEYSLNLKKEIKQDVYKTFLAKTIKHFVANYGTNNIIKSAISIQEEIKPFDDSLEFEIPKPVIKIMLEVLQKWIKDTSDVLTHWKKTLKHYVDNLDSAEAANLIYNINEIVIRNLDMSKVYDILSALQDEKIPFMHITENRNTVDWIKRGINAILGDIYPNNENNIYHKYQYNQFALLTNQKDEFTICQNIYAVIQKTFDERPFNTNGSIKISVLKNTPEQKLKEINLKALYPMLKKDIKQLKFHAGTPKKFRQGVSFDYTYLLILWKAFNKIKNALMFIGYSEKKSAEFIAKRVFKCCPISLCELTKQLVPEIFLVPLTLKNGTTIQCNAYFIYICNALYNYQPRYMLSEDKTKWIENALSSKKEFLTTKHNHMFNVLEILTPRALPFENTQIYNKNKGYRPIPYLGVELEVERKPEQPSSPDVRKLTIGPTENFIIEEGPYDNTPEVDLHLSETTYDLLGRDFVIFKHDGTLNGYDPWEIVSIPATIAYHKTRWHQFLDDKTVKPHLQSFASGACGMHVHISRDSFTGLHLAKFMRFINCKENNKFIWGIAQRNSGEFCRYTDIAGISKYAACIHRSPENGDREGNKYYRRHPEHHGHYGAVNTDNQNTVEVRIFRGNLNKVAFFKNLEFVHALWQYTQTCSMNELNYKDFLCWLFDESAIHHKLYNNLEKWLMASKFNLMNVTIKRDTPEEEKKAMIEKRKKIKKMQIYLERRFKPKEKSIDKPDEILMAV